MSTEYREMLARLDAQLDREARARAAEREARLEREALERRARRRAEKAAAARQEAEAIRGGAWSLILPPWGEAPEPGTISRDEPGWRVIGRAPAIADADRLALAGVLPPAQSTRIEGV